MQCSSFSHQFKKVFFVFLFMSLFFVSSFAGDIRIGLSLSKKRCKILEKKINKSLNIALNQKNTPKVVVLSIFSYDKKRNVLLNNKIDLLESGFGMFYEANKYKGKIRRKFKVLLHASYYDNITSPFYIRGVIFSRREDNLSLKDIIHCKKIFAVSPSSSSGYYLQNKYLSGAGFKYAQPDFLLSHRKIADAVVKNRGSIGFCASFINLDLKKFKILYRSGLAPGGLIFARASIASDILNVIKNEIIKYYMLLLKKSSKKMNRIFFNKFEIDYMTFCNMLKVKKSWFSKDVAIFWVIIGSLIIVIIILVQKQRKADAIKRYEKNLLINLKNEHLNFDPEGLWYCNLKNSIEQKNKGNYRDAIMIATGIVIELTHRDIPKGFDSESIKSVLDAPNFMKVLLLRINNLGIDEFKMKISSESYKMIGQLNSIVCPVVKAAMAEPDGYPFTKDENFKKLIGISDFDGLLSFIRTYRNFSVHDHSKLLSEEAAKLVIYMVFHMHRELYKSKLFSTSGE